MGQQSSSQHSEQAPPRKSYYELLGIEKSATEDEIKKSYRRKALELHPDRNYGHVEEATKLFAEVQSAYEILSDPQERAWYDSHEEAVLSGLNGSEAYDGSIPVTTAEDIAKLYANFSGRSDFSDSSSGFFTSLRETFDTLAREETLAGEYADTETPDYPSFGSSKDDYEDVVRPFYVIWSGFATRKDFAWKDIYRLSEAPDRRVRRAMEKENKRLRDEAIRDFNDTIRMLVAFVRKRDPRVKEATAVSDSQRQQTLRDQTAAQAARARAANKAKLDEHMEADWMKPIEADDEQETFWDEDDEEPVEHYECVVCDKVFKTDKQFESHERSKKHLQAVKKMQRDMRKQGLDLGLDSGSQVQTEPSDVPDPKDEVDSELYGEGVPEHKADDDMHEQNVQSSSDIPKTTSPDVEEPDVAAFDPNESGDEAAPSGSTSDDDYAPRETVSERLTEAIADLEVSGDTDDVAESTGKKVGKAKEKRARRAAKQAAEPAEAQGNTCARCTAQFPSKTKLFDHLRQHPDHAKLVQGGKIARRSGKKR